MTTKREIHQMMYNGPAGDYYINRYSSENEYQESPQQEGYYREEFAGTPDEVEKYLKDWEESSSCWVVFVNESDGDVFVSPESDLSGNWMGSKYPFHRLSGCFGDLSDAQKRKKEMVSCLD
ncbi:hypothetical protein ACFLY7_02625 [Patescibacteria group bacterium]